MGPLVISCQGDISCSSYSAKSFSTNIYLADGSQISPSNQLQEPHRLIMVDSYSNGRVCTSLFSMNEGDNPHIGPESFSLWAPPHDCDRERSLLFTSRIGSGDTYHPQTNGAAG
ncbi:hypothetical protein RRG08_051439 [Elysia crispata]|uniref:Uncharacterized protein n=1 Tax=Elysia crispata TaxID=231223 RepID=A0AAE1B4T9_9GAST|nr:hypothetical protein RRG08_051439 [Elysia crispata]